VTSFADRQWASRFSIEPLVLEVHKAGTMADADANSVMVQMGTLEGGTPVFSRQATHTGTGTYEILLSSVETSTPGIFQIQWTYSINAVPQTYIGLLEVGETTPAYDRLPIGFKGIIESVYMRFADLFDSPNGGPHLQVYFQTNFGRGRMAQLLQVAVGRLNSIAQPHGTYTLDEQVSPFPFQKWGPLLEQGLYIETIKHLIRSYTEQPTPENVVIARLDRRDYVDRWRAVLADEAEDYKNSLDVFKIANMGLGRPSVLVSGGVFGNYGPTRLPGAVMARGGQRWGVYY
jgi:hypothetical protein